MIRESLPAGSARRISPLWLVFWLAGLCGYFLAVVAGLAPWAATDVNYWLRWIGAVSFAAALLAAFERLLDRHPLAARFDGWLRDLEQPGARSWGPLLPLAALFAGGVWLLLLALGLPLYLQESRFVLVPWSWQAIALCAGVGGVAALALKAALRGTRDAGWSSDSHPGAAPPHGS